MHFINNLLLSVTFLASVTLLVMMWQRKLIRRLFLFFVLLLFYVLRSAALLIGMNAFDRTAYLQVAFLTSLVDLGLQLALAYSLTRSLTRLQLGAQGAATSRLRDSALFLFTAALVLAGGLTVAIVSALPAFSPVPLDRGVLFSGLVFLLLLFFVRNRKASSPEGAVLIGFCVVSAANILSQLGKMMAAAHHDPRLFVGWAYGNTAVWICVLMFWILRLQSSQTKPYQSLGKTHPQSELNPL